MSLGEKRRLGNLQPVVAFFPNFHRPVLTLQRGQICWLKPFREGETMHIDDYQLGTIVIEGQTYNADLMICGEALLQDWWHQMGIFNPICDYSTVDLTRRSWSGVSPVISWCLRCQAAPEFSILPAN